MRRRIRSSLVRTRSGDRHAPGIGCAEVAVIQGDGRLYSRSLPGGGYVSIESAPESSGSPHIRAMLLVERRADPTRRVGHQPPVVAETVAIDSQHALDELFAIAANNVEVARALQRWQSSRGTGGI
jgi:hypothetical protein